MGEREYSFEEGILKIIDPDFGLNIQESFNPLKLPEGVGESEDNFSFREDCEYVRGKEGILQAAFMKREGMLSGERQTYHPTGALKSCCYYIQEEGFSYSLLHGPSTCYSSVGDLLSIRWFYRGQEEGRAYCYYPSGEVYSELGYLHGKEEGEQRYYYPDASLKSSLFYHKGLLDGFSSLHHPDGSRYRRIPHCEGKKHGLEEEWNRLGIKVAEREYTENFLKREKHWSSRGVPTEELWYHPSSAKVERRCWSAEGYTISS